MLNKRLIASINFGVVLAIIVLWAGIRQHWFSSTPSLELAVMWILSALAFPMRLYVIFVLGENGSWSLPLLAVLLLLSGLLWGLIVERGLYYFHRRRRSNQVPT